MTQSAVSPLQVETSEQSRIETRNKMMELLSCLEEQGKKSKLQSILKTNDSQKGQKSVRFPEETNGLVQVF